MRAVVVGAGLVGSCFAFRAAQAGLEVVVVEAGRPGHGASLGSFAWLNAHNKLPRSYHDFTLRALAAHGRLRSELGVAGWHHGGGAVEWAAGEEAIARQAERVSRLLAWGSAVEWLTLRQLRELEPDIDPAAVGDAPIAYYPADGWIDPVLLVAAALGAAKRLGAVRVSGRAVALRSASGGRVTGVDLENGEAVEGDLVVNCTGAALNALAPDAPGVPLLSKPGLTAITRPAPVAMRRVIKAASCYLRPDGAGRLMLHAKEADAALTQGALPSPDLPAVRELLRRADAIVPGSGSVGVDAIRIVTRPYPADGLPAVGRLPGVDGYYVAVMHSGAILAPLMGELILDDILRGSDALEPYRPSRFFHRSQAT